MQSKSYREIEFAEESDIGKICLMYLGGPTLAIEDTLEGCLEIACIIEK
jgi:hypothetical protein